MIVVDCSVIIYTLLNQGSEQASEILRTHRLFAPSILPYEVLNVLRREKHKKNIPDVDKAFSLFRKLFIEYESFDSLEPITLKLVGNMTAYDAAYVALALKRDIPLLTLDERLRQQARCKRLNVTL